MRVTTKPLEIRGRLLGGHGPSLICTPLVGRTAAALTAELLAILPKSPDLIEWRVDFFDAIADQGRVLAAAAELRALARGIPIIFTRRAVHEGGEPIALEEDAVVDLYAALCASGDIDIVDYELSQPEHHRRRVRAVSQAYGVALIVSCHDFVATPPNEQMLAILLHAAREGADIAKLAVMPCSQTDVLRLLEASLQASAELTVPLISMSMGSLGAVTRICGWLYGSSVSFAVGQRISAPGQVPIETLRDAMAALRDAE